MHRYKDLITFFVGWNGIITRPARSFVAGMTAGFLIDQLSIYITQPVPVEALFVVVVAASIFAFFFRLSKDTGGSALIRKEAADPTEPKPQLDLGHV